MTYITVKDWIGLKVVDEMAKYHLAANYRCVDDADFGRYYIDRKNKTISFYIDGILKDTAKATQVALQCETTGERAHEPYRAWFPKSQIIAIESE